MKSFENVQFKGIFRDYQQNVLDNANRFLSDGKINIVAAPGSGKTILGLELIKRLGNPTIILSPTTTIRQQWKERFGDFFIGETESVDDYVSTNLNDIKLINSITYQALHAAINKIISVDEDEEKIEYKFDLFDLIKEKNIKTICLDEAHHLQNEWQKALEKFISEIDKEVKVISLTATPPYDAKTVEWQRYLDVCGEIDEEIFVPELVKKSTLCPHQDYIYFNYPTPDEVEEFEVYKRNAYSAMNEFILLPFLHDLSITINKTYNQDYDRLYNNTKEYIALLVTFKYANFKISNKLIKIITTVNYLPDFNLQFGEIAFQFLLDSDLCNNEEKEQLILILKKYHLYNKNTVSLDLNEKLKRKIISSIGKLDSIGKIVEAEYENLKNNLRMLILTDYIKKENISQIATDKSFTSISVVSVFEILRRKTSSISICVLSGTLVIISRSILSNLNNLCVHNNISYHIEEIFDTDYNIVKFSGSNKDKVKIISELFSQGLIQVLIGTKSLLGEGWDSPCINSLILASFVGSFVVSNQMRGRAIRIDKANPNKTANIWHLVTIEPDYLFEENILKRTAAKLIESKNHIKSCDFETIERRFNCFVGPSYEANNIESGIERISVLKPPYDKEKIASINLEMLKLAKNREGLIQKWNDSLVQSSKLSIVNEVPKDKKVNPFTFENTLLLAMIISLESALINSIASNIMRFNFTGFDQVVFIICFIIIAIYSRKLIYQLLSHLSPQKSIKTLANCILKTLKDIDIINTASTVKVNSDDYGIFIQTILVNGTIYEQNVFNNAIKELLSPIENPRYVIIKKSIFGFDYSKSLACPSIIGKKKEYVEIFRNNLVKSLGKLEIIFTRNEDGRKLIMTCRKKSYITRNSKALGVKKKVNNWE